MLSEKEFRQMEAALLGMKNYSERKDDRYHQAPYVSLYAILELLKQYINDAEE